MENENKNAKGSNEQKNRKNKQRKHKSYFMTPANVKPEGDPAPQADKKANSNNKQQSKSNERPNAVISSTEKRENKNSPAPSANQGQKQENSSNPSNKHKNKHKRHSDKKVTDKNSAISPKLEKEAPAQNNTHNQATVKPAAKKPDKFEKPSLGDNHNKYENYEEFSYEELYGDKEALAPMPNASPDEKEEITAEEALVDVVGIKFKSSGKTYYFAPKGYFLKTGSYAIVETSRGPEYGEVALGNTKVKESETVPPLRPVIRPATEADKKRHAENKQKEEDAFRLCNEKIIEHELDMKLIDAQYTFDNSKLLFYFTSSGRVDFRNLVKDLAGVFRTRIELRQIGIRDEAKMLGGLGLCGRPLCCSLFLTDFGQVSIKMAKEQNLSLNSSKISGICGRLMCCLRYEHDTYEYEIKRTPPVDTVVKTVDGIGVVTEISPLTATIKVKLDSSPDIPAKSYKRNEVSILKKKKGN